MVWRLRRQGSWWGRRLSHYVPTNSSCMAPVRPILAPFQNMAQSRDVSHEAIANRPEVTLPITTIRSKAHRARRSIQVARFTHSTVAANLPGATKHAICTQGQTHNRHTGVEHFSYGTGGSGPTKQIEIPCPVFGLRFCDGSGFDGQDWQR